MVSCPFFYYFIVQVQNVSSPLHNLICGLVHISEIMFPEKDIRFIAINDGVDSDQDDGDFTPFRNVKLTKLFIKKLQKSEEI